MEPACLVTGKSSQLLAEIVHHSIETQHRTLVARSGHLELPGPETPAASTVTWNRRSPLSARSVILHAQNLYKRLDQAIIAYSPTRETVPFHESSIVSIEDRVDAEVKGYQFLLREIIGLFQKQGQGRLILAVLDNGGELRSPLAAAALGSFMAAAEAMRRYYQNERFGIQLLYSQSEDAQAYARFILQTMIAAIPRRQRGSWIRFPSRSGIFTLGR